MGRNHVLEFWALRSPEGEARVARRNGPRNPSLIALGFAAWTLLGLFFSLRFYLLQRQSSTPSTWGNALEKNLPEWYLWGIVTLIVVRLSRRFAFGRGKLLRRLILHCMAAIVLASAHLLVFDLIVRTMDPEFGRRMPLPAALVSLFIFKFNWGFLTYWVILLATHGWDYYRRFREKELRASQLEAKLAQAQLHALRMQLQPHFLFNTLHTISALIRIDPEAADRTLAHLSQMLRLTLDRIGVEEVSLQDELEFVERYLKIERTRFNDRMSVAVDVQPETLAAMVPCMILQPLVENAIRHVLARHSRAGKVEIRARREGEELRVGVLDDGGGFPAGFRVETSRGIGLRITQERLLRLYGERQRMEIGSRTQGGAAIAFWIPFRKSLSK